MSRTSSRSESRRFSRLSQALPNNALFAVRAAEPRSSRRPRRNLSAIKPRAVLFDFNGTLSHDAELWFEVYRELFAELGLSLATGVGVAAAKAAGMRCVAVLGTVARASLADADEIVDALDARVVRRLLT